MNRLEKFRSRLSDRLFGGVAGNVFRGMAVLASGSVTARLVGVASIPILTRIYGPEDFGVLSVFTALVAILVPVLTLRYVVALPLPRHDGMAMNLLVLSMGLMFVMATIVGILLWVFGPSLLGLMSMEVLVPWWWLVLVGLVGTGTYEILSMWATRKRAYKIVARTQVTQSVLGAFVKIGLGAIAFKPLGLLVGQIAAQTGGVGTFARQFASDFRKNWRHVDMSRLRFAVRRYASFPIYRLPSQVLLIFSMQAPLVFTAVLYGAETAGQFGLASMALALPLSLLGQSMGKAYYGEIAKIKSKPAEVFEVTRITQVRLLFIGVTSAAFIFLFGSELFQVAFGGDWSQAGDFASIMAFYAAFQFTSAPLVNVLNLYDMQFYFLILNIFRAIIVTAIFYFSLIFSLSELIFVISISASLAILYILISIFIIFKLRSLAFR